MTTKERNKQMILLYSDGMNYADLGRRFTLTLERVRQILNPQLKFYCKKHKRKHYKSICELCSLEKEYLIKIKQNVDKVIQNLSNRRDNLTVTKRKILVKYLRDIKKMSFQQIAKLLDRDYTSILYLYKK